MSQRIADSLEVLDLVRQYAGKDKSSGAFSWRSKAIEHVASRGVEKNTVFAHLVGKNTSVKVSAWGIDKLIEAWVHTGSEDLKNWMLSAATHSDKLRIERFFLAEATTPVASDINEPSIPERTLVTTYRVLRDTALARRIKADEDYKCQLCGVRIILRNGQPYAEAHHVKPLGKPHEGPDTPDNILCVCPNCHVRLDYGAVRLTYDVLKNIRTEFINYHNENICNA
jgi:hypothetical protein